MKKIANLMFVVAMVCLSGQALAGGHADKGKALFAVCATCHGPDGKGLEAFNAPNLTGLQEWYIVRQLENFRSGVRGADAKDTYGMQMRPMALVLANSQGVEDVAAYIVTLEK